MSKRYEPFPYELADGQARCRGCLKPVVWIESADSRSGRLALDMMSRQVERDGRETYVAHFTLCAVKLTSPTPQRTSYRRRPWFPREYESEPARRIFGRD